MTFQFESFSEFLSMGEHGLYVWLAYAVGLFVLGFNVWSAEHRRKQLIRNIQQVMRRESDAGEEYNT